MRKILFLFVMLCVFNAAVYAQSETGTISGRITDPSGAVIIGAICKLANIDTNISSTTKTNEAGLYVFTSLKPGNYRVTVDNPGFHQLVKTGIVLHVQDSISENFSLQLGSVSESMTVTADAVTLQTTPEISTVIGSKFVDNLPLNGRTIQNLIALTPGTLAFALGANEGMISVNGLRSTENYLTIDGVSANLYVGSNGTNSGVANGTIPGYSLLGLTSNMISVDALQEFKVQSASYSAEFGRSPGAQIQLTTKSGTNKWHGGVFEYFRNDKLDAADWFVNANHLTKPPLRDNDFGGTFGGPVWKDHTFFFFSYEGTRIRLPKVVSSVSVPSRQIRQTAATALQPILNIFPLPTGPDDANGLTASYSASYSNPQTQDATSIRVDHVLSPKITVFGRYSNSPQDTMSFSLQNANASHNTGQTTTLTVGATIRLASALVNEVRFNRSLNNSKSGNTFLSVNGAQPLPHSLLFPAPLPDNSQVFFSFGTAGSYTEGQPVGGERRTIDFNDNLSWMHGRHLLKFGFGYQRSGVDTGTYNEVLSYDFTSLAQLQTGVASGVALAISNPPYTQFNWHSASAFAQDTWKLAPKLTLDYGIRWDLSPPPVISPPIQPVVLDGVSPVHFAKAGTPLFPTLWANFAPRVGLAYEISGSNGRGFILRGGYGLFYSGGSGSLGSVNTIFFPYSGRTLLGSLPFPLSPSQLAPPVISTTPPYGSGPYMAIYDTQFALPRVHQWNVTVEKALGTNQTVTASYVGNAGRRLLRINSVNPVSRLYPVASPDFAANTIVAFNTNRPPYDDTSDYDALQIQFKREAGPLNVLMNYTWAHAIDTGSTSTNLQGSNLFSGYKPAQDRASSVMDRRHILSSAVTWELPALSAGGELARVGNAVTRDWSLASMIQAQSAQPADVTYTYTNQDITFSAVRPDLVLGVPLWITDPTVAGGRRANAAAFSIPAENRQGNLSRNALRGFPLVQLDLAFGRQFSLTEQVKLHLRLEMFNFPNHPNFGFLGGGLGTKSASGTFTKNTNFGKATNMVRAYNNMSSLYSVGGPRSIQLSLRLSF